MQKPLGERDLLSLKARYQQVLQLTSNAALRKVVQGRLELLEKEELRERLARRFIELVRQSRAKDRALLAGKPAVEATNQDFADFTAPAAPPVPAGDPADGQAYGEPLSSWFDDPFATSAARDDVAASGERVPGSVRPADSLRQQRFQVPADGTSSVPNLPPGYRVLEGVLHPYGSTPDGRRRYVVRDRRSGRILGYVVETVGLNLEPYVGKLVRVTGRELSPGHDAGGVVARRIEPVRR